MLRFGLEVGWANSRCDGETVVLDIRFHTAIAELSDSRFLMKSNDMLQPHLTFDWNFVRSSGMPVERKDRRMTRKHLAIVEAIASGDARRTRPVMDSQMGGSERRAFLGQP